MVLSHLHYSCLFWLVRLHLLFTATWLLQVSNLPNIITAWRFCVTLISANYFTVCQAAYPFYCNMAFLYWQRRLLWKIIRTHIFLSMFFIISSFIHHSTHCIVCATDFFCSYCWHNQFAQPIYKINFSCLLYCLHNQFLSIYYITSFL